MKLCLVRLSALGDVVLMVPLVRTLQAAIPNVELTWITSRGAYSILEGLSGVNFKVIDKPNSPSDYWKFYQSMKHESFDVLLAAQASFRANLLYPLIKAKRKIGFDSGRSKDGHRYFIRESIEARQEHLLEGFLGFARALGVEKTELRWDLPITNADRQFAEATLGTGNWLAVNPAASKPERNWIPKRYAEVIQYARETLGLSVVLTGGPGEAEQQLAQAVLSNCQDPETIVNLVGKTTPKQLAAILERVRVLVSPDTGPAHIATAMGTPVIGLYAVAPSALSGPYCSKGLVIDEFSNAVQQLLKKDPNTIPWGTRVHSPKAMEFIEVESVIMKLQAVMV